MCSSHLRVQSETVVVEADHGGLPSLEPDPASGAVEEGPARDDDLVAAAVEADEAVELIDSLAYEVEVRLLLLLWWWRGRARAPAANAPVATHGRDDLAEII